MQNKNIHLLFWSKLAHLLPSQTVVLQKLAHDCLTLIAQKASLSADDAKFKEIIADLQLADQDGTVISSIIQQLKEENELSSDFDRAAVEIYIKLADSLKEIIPSEDYLDILKIFG